MPHIAIVDCYDSFVYNIVEYARNVASTEIDVIPCKAIDAKRINFRTTYDGIILSPGPGHPLELPLLSTIIHQAETTYTPLLGICLGMQAIACTYGASLINLQKPLHGHAERLCDCLADDPFIYEGQLVARYHSWIVDTATLPSALECTAYAQSDHSPMALRHKQYPFYGTQFHPESYITQHGFEIIKNWIESL